MGRMLPSFAMTATLHSSFVPEPVLNLLRRMQERGHKAYVVGGAVRELLVGEKPGPQDWDLGTSATPDEVLALSDIVSLHVPLLASTRHMISTRELGLMQKHAYLINTCRGPVVDEVALTRALSDGTIAGGMIPKVETCIDALERGVEAVVILDGKVPHAVLLELFTELGAGTLFRR